MKNKTNIVYVSKAIFLAYIITFILLLISSLAIQFTNFQESHLQVTNNIVIVVSVSLASIYVAIKIKKSGWLYGAMVGFVYYLIILFLNIIFTRMGLVNAAYLGKLVIVTIIGSIGGILGINLV